MADTAAAPRGRLAGAAFIMMAAFVASRMTGLLRDIAITWQFGTGPEIGAYIAANRIPDFVFQVTAGGAVASAFIPVFARYVGGDDATRAAGWRMVSTLFNVAAVVLLPILGVLMVLAPDVTALLAPGLGSEYQALAGNLARVLMIAPLVFTLGCFATSVLNSYQRFFLASLAPTCYNLGILAGALLIGPLFGASPRDRIYGLAVGATLGSFLFLIVQVPGLVRVGMRYAPVIDLTHAGVREVGRLMVPRTIGLGVAQVNFLVATSLASFIPDGIAALNWAWLLTMLPLGVFGMAISSAVFPSLAAQTASDALDDLRRTVSTSLRFILFLTIPAAIGLILLGEQVVQVLFERGAFSAASTAMTAHALRFYAPGLVAMAAVEITTRVFYAFHDTRTPVVVAVAVMIVNVALALLLVGPLSFAGLALATALASTFEAFALLRLVQRRLPALLDQATWSSVGKSSAAALLMGAVLAVALPVIVSITPPNLLGRAIALGALIVTGGAIYLAASLAFGSEELEQLRQLGPVNRVLRRLGRS